MNATHAITDMDVRSDGSRLRGDMTYGVGGPVLEVRNVRLSLEPADFRLFETLNGKPFPYPWNGTITPHRKVAFSEITLADVKEVKDAFGVTVNDVVLAVVAGALRRYLDAREELPDRPLVAVVPTNVRTESTRGVAGIPDLMHHKFVVRDGETGLLVPPGDATDFP